MNVDYFITKVVTYAYFLFDCDDLFTFDAIDIFLYILGLSNFRKIKDLKFINNRGQILNIILIMQKLEQTKC